MIWCKGKECSLRAHGSTQARVHTTDPLSRGQEVTGATAPTEGNF